MLVENLRRLGIEKLDYIMISHSHSDHIYGVTDEKGVLANIPVGEVLISGVYNGGLDNPYLVDDLCKEKGIPVRTLKKGDVLELGEATLLKAGIQEIEKLDVDLLKIPHHGHNTSSSVSFVMAVKPEIAVAMGYCNMSSAVRNAYLMSSTDVVTDRNNGYVHIYTDGQTMMKDVQRAE